jgi:hypothetical protein
MGTVANPLYTNLVSGMNPTGSQISLGGAVPGAAPGGANQFLPQSSTSLSSSGPVSGNPFAGGAVPGSPIIASPTAMTTPGINAGGYSSTGGGMISPSGSAVPGPGNYQTTASQSPIGGMSLMSQKDLSRMFSSLKSTYGDGMAHMIMDFLMTGAGFNKDAVNNLLASLAPGIERGQENLMEQFSVSGNRFGSGAQIGLADYLSQVNLNEGQLITQMYEKSLDDFMSVMMGTAGKHADLEAGKPGIWDSIMGGMGLASSAAGGLSDAGVGGGSGTLSSILSGIAAI